MPSVRIAISDEVAARHHREIRLLVRMAFEGVDPSGVEIRVERARRSAESFTGRAYDGRPARSRSDPATRYLVRLRLPGMLRNGGYPRSYRYPGRRTAPWITVRDWRERLVALAAHEACHVRQFREGLRRSEVEAERWAAHRLAQWADEGRMGVGALQLELFAG
jgi:hypothetical protein